MTSRTKKISEHLIVTGVLPGYNGRSRDEPIEWETAYALDEILTSASKVENHLLPALLAATNAEIALALLEDIREELKHISYHIYDSSYFSIVMDKQ